MQKELVLQFPKRKLSHSIQSAIMHSQSHRGYHNASLLPSPQVSLTVASFLGAPRRLSVTMPPFSQVPSSPCLMLSSWEPKEVISLLFYPLGQDLTGDWPWALPDTVATPGELVCTSNESDWGSAVQRVRTPV